MSWFKRGGERKSPESSDLAHSDTDPNTCLEVFQNHWKQAWNVISCQEKKWVTSNGQSTPDGVEAVLSNLEQMVTLLVSEDDDGGLPGPILRFVLESELLEKICGWCTINISAHERLRMQQLRIFELIISQSKQLLLVHKPVIKPLLRLLIDVADSQEIANGELEFKLVLVLHQICICISQQSLILESFFSTDADHGPARFLIFSLLIPYIHREGPVGQKARDALLLIMTLSARHPHIGQYIANNSDFCPVLATGLSGLYSSLPRRITPLSDDWHAITRDDCVRIPDLQMFLNSLQFSNAVVQVAHPLVRNQLIDFIYSGFLVPVLAPALHQDIPGLPIPLLDTDLFRISREEVMTATAYLDLFIRHVTDPHLLKAVMKFVLTEKYDEMPILDTFLSRISSNSNLSTVTLALFHTLVDLNCEDIMFQLVFRYLVPCTHVMVSQRRSVRDLDLYGKSAEKFLSLRPSCCIQNLPPAPTPIPTPAPPPHIVGMNTSNQTWRSPVNTNKSVTSSPSPATVISSSDGSGSQNAGETNYFEYLHDARNKLEQSAWACRHWLYTYDGESPLPDSIKNLEKVEQSKDVVRDGKETKEEDSQPQTGYIELGSILKKSEEEETKVKVGRGRGVETQVTFAPKAIEISNEDSVFLSREKCNTEIMEAVDKKVDEELYASLDNMDTFMEYLSEKEDDGSPANGQSINESIATLEEALRIASSGGLLRTSSTKDRTENDSCPADQSIDSVDVSSLSPIPADTTTQFSFSNQTVVSAGGDSKLETLGADKTSFEEISASEMPVEPKVTMQNNQPDPEATSYVDISIVPNNCNSSSSDPNVSSRPVGDDSAISVTASSAGAGVIPSTIVSSTTKLERNVPKDFPSSLKSNLHSASHLSTSSVFSPLKQLMSPGDGFPSYRSILSPGDDLPAMTPSSPAAKKVKYSNDPPNIGPFLSSLFLRLEGMIGNSLYFNLLLTSVLSRLAAYPQPLLRSFLLNQNLVFQPSVKSLIQVLSSLRQKLDSFSVTVKQFDTLVNKARLNLAEREELLYQSVEQGMMGSARTVSFTSQYPVKTRADTIAAAQPIREKKKVSLSDLIFRRSPGKDKMSAGRNNKKHSQLQKVQVGGSTGYLYINSHGGSDPSSSSTDSHHYPLSTWNAVYCALVLDEFLKELSALSQEHSVVYLDEGYLSS